MRILLDENVPRPLKRLLRSHSVSTVQEMGWAGLENGDLARVAVPAGFEVLLTADRNLAYQQNVAELGLALVVVTIGGIRLEDIEPTIPAILDVLASHPDVGTISIVGERLPRT